LLEGAELTIALLSGIDDEGQPVTSPFDTTATADRERPEAKPSKAPRASRPDDGIPF
jgi:exodeoxyribonuclease VII small subunit